MSCGYHQSGLDWFTGQRIAKGICDSHVAPFLQRQTTSVRQGIVEILGQQHFTAPAIVAVPAHGFQEPASRHHGIGQAVPEIPPAIAVGIHRVFQEDGGHELDVAHGAGPGTLHLVSRYGALINNAQGGNQLLGKEGAAAGITGQGCQGAGYRHLAEITAEVGFQAPERHQVGCRYAGFPGDPGQQILVFLKQFTALADPGLVNPSVQVVGERCGELRLPTVQLDHPGQMLNSGHHLAGGLAADPGGNGLFLKPGFAFGKPRRLNLRVVLGEGGQGQE